MFRNMPLMYRLLDTSQFGSAWWLLHVHAQPLAGGHHHNDLSYHDCHSPAGPRHLATLAPLAPYDLIRLTTVSGIADMEVQLT